MIDEEKPLFWIGSCKGDLLAFPADVQDVMGYALDLAQRGGKHPGAKPLKGFGGAGVLEVVDDFDGDTYRAVHSEVQWRRVCPPRLPEEVEERFVNDPSRHGEDQTSIETG